MGYLIQTTATLGHLRNWKFEGSNDSNNWDTLDVRSNDSSLNSHYQTNCFQLDKPSPKYEYFRIIQTGPNAACSHSLIISYFDIFGKLEF